MTLRIEKSERQGITVFTLIGRIDVQEIPQLEELFGSDHRDIRDIVLDLAELRLADRGAVRFLRRCEARGIKLENCPAYIREWIERERD
jgi:anti-anti-sigma regulatory factor